MFTKQNFAHHKEINFSKSKSTSKAFIADFTIFCAIMKKYKHQFPK